MDEFDQRRSEYQSQLNEIWKQAIKTAFGDAPPVSKSWSDPYQAVDVLSHFMQGNYSFLPPNGHLPLEGVGMHEDGRRMQFELSDTGLLELSPSSMTFEFIESAPIESFFLIDVNRMKPSGIYESVSDSEQVLRVDDEDFDYAIAEHGVWGHDDGGNELPVPEDAKTVLRLLHSGKLLIVSKGSMWNHTTSTWDGRHNFMSAMQVRSVIERSLLRETGQIDSATEGQK